MYVTSHKSSTMTFILVLNMRVGLGIPMGRRVRPTRFSRDLHSYRCRPWNMAIDGLQWSLSTQHLSWPRQSSGFSRIFLSRQYSSSNHCPVVGISCSSIHLPLAPCQIKSRPQLLAPSARLSQRWYWHLSST